MNSTVSKPAAPSAPPGRAGTVSDAAASAGTNLFRAAIITVVLVVAGTAGGLIPRWRHRAALRTLTRELAVPSVSVVRPALDQASTGLLLPAEVKPWLEAPIYARASGYLKRWLVDIGAHVEEGELLAEIDTPELNQELAQARAQVLQAQAALNLAQTTAARWAELLKTASVSEQETAEKQADFELKSANLEAAKANVRRLEELQSFESVRAPFAGTITVRRTDVGQLVAAAGGQELFRLAQTGKLRVYTRVPQSAARGIAAGQTAEMIFPEVRNRVFPARVLRTSGAMSADSRTLLTELEVDNSAGEILSGSYAQVRFTEAKAASVLSLPSNTLLFRSEGPQVGVVGPDGTVTLRAVSLGRDFGPTLEVLGGVEPSDRVILNPADSLVSGAVVRVAENAAESGAIREARNENPPKSN